MSRGRPRSPIEMTDKKLSLPLDLTRQVDSLLLDPLYGKPQAGAWSDLVSRLLTDWLDRQRKVAQQNFDLFDKEPQHGNP